MALQFYLLEPGIAVGTAAETDQRDLPRQVISKAVILNMDHRVNSTSAGNTRTGVSQQMDQIRIGAVESNRIAEIDGRDLDAFNVLNGNITYFLSGTTISNFGTIGMVYPFDPFLLQMQPDYNQNFGISPAVARKVEVAFLADAVSINSKNLAIGVIAKDSADQNATGGYTTFTRNATTYANGANTFTSIPQPGNLLGIHVFETTSTDTGVTTLRTATTIQEVAITLDRKDIIGPLYPNMIRQFGADYVSSLSSNNYFFLDLGFRNYAGALGRGPIPDKLEIRAKGGSTADAGRVYAVRLNTNV